MNVNILISVEKQKFDLAIKALLTNPYPLFPFIQRYLQQFHITEREVSDIFNEAYIRGVKLIESGEIIRNASAWMRTTCFNVIREISRKQRRSQPVEQSFLEYKIAQAQFKICSSLEEVITSDLEIVQIALEQLNLKDKVLLHLRIVEGLSWQEVGKRLSLEEGKLQSEDTVRKRGQRALERLRKIWKSINLD